MRQYEMTYLVSDKVSDNDLTAATGKINGLITSHKGKVLAEDNWGRRKLAYPINKQDFATYVTLNFELDPTQLTALTRELRLTTEITRHLLIVKDYGKEELKLTADEVAEAEDIEKVVGGDRSFEAVSGETEESYDLMAKRSEVEEDKGATEEAVEVQTTEEQVAEKVEEEEESAPEKKTTKKKAKKAAEENKEEIAEPNVEEEKAKKPAKKKVVKAEAKKEENKKAEEEADRLAKLDEEIEGILGDDL